MTKTEHYQLNQWDAADPIRREDFNADNATIDAALAAVKREAANELAQAREEIAVLIRLGHYVSTNGSVNAVFDLSKVDLSQYAELKLWIGGITATEGELLLRFNGDSGSKYISSGSVQSQYTLLTLSVNTYPASFAVQIVDEPRERVHFLSTVQNYQTINGGAGYSTSYGMYTGCGLNGIRSIQVYGSQSLNAGIELVLYGIKKS